MSLGVVWVTEDWEALAAMVDREDVLIRYLPDEHEASWHCLRFLERWGHAIFNQTQLTWLLIDLERLHEAVEPLDDKERIESLIEFVRRAIGEDDTFIRFIGD